MKGEGFAPGKIILFGEHSVVYGAPALAAALPWGVRAQVEIRAAGGLECAAARADARVAEALALLAGRLGVSSASVAYASEIPEGAGLGSSAAFAVATVRALAAATGTVLSDDEVIAHASEAERVFHGRPSGLDATVCTRAGVVAYRRGPPVSAREVTLRGRLAVVVAHSGVTRATRTSVEAFASRLVGDPDRWRPRVERLGAIAEAAVGALEAVDRIALGVKMNDAHALLAECGLSCPELDAIVRIAREAGADGAKLTGAGNGGAAIAVGPDPERLAAAIRAGGYEARIAEIG